MLLFTFYFILTYLRFRYSLSFTFHFSLFTFHFYDMNDFPKAERLCNYHSIQALFKQGKSIKKYPLKLIYLPSDKVLTPTQLLISVPKKKLKRAVDRNRIKRLIRESYRKQKHQLSSQDKSYSLALIYMSDELVSYEQIHTLVAALLRQLSLSV